MNQYNNKYINVFYEGRKIRLYDEKKTTSYDALYSETQIKLIEFIENYNFQIFYFFCEPLNSLKLKVDDNCIDLNSKDVEQIKNNQQNDFYYFYKNQICEVFYSFLKLDEKNNYYFDFMLVVDSDFDLNKVLKLNFLSVKIISVDQVYKEKITFDFVKNIFEKRTLILNDMSRSQDKSYYNLDEIDYSLEDYKKNIKNGDSDFEWLEYINFSSFYFQKNFNADTYVKNVFRLLCSHIWALDRFYYVEKNKYGLMSTYKDLLDINALFLTNYASIIGAYSFDIDSKEIKKECYTYSCIYDNTHNQGIILSDFSKSEIDGKINFRNLLIFDAKFKYE